MTDPSRTGTATGAPELILPNQRNDQTGGREPRPGSQAATVREIGPYVGLGWVLAVAVVGCTLLGVYLDRRWGTGPWLTLGGVLLGVGSGMFAVLRTLLGKDGDGTGRRS
jgi:F0F1-type ATP synthase assembly protein I